MSLTTFTAAEKAALHAALMVMLTKFDAPEAAPSLSTSQHAHGRAPAFVNQFENQLSRLKHEVKLSEDQDAAALLGLTKAAFSGRKRRNAFPADKLWALAAQRPDLSLDVDYILTGLDVGGTHKSAFDKSSYLRERLREERKRLGLNQAELAALAGIHGKTQSYYEAGKRVPDTNYLRAIAAACADVTYILGLEPQPI